MRYLTYSFSLLVLLFLQGCSDNATVNILDAKIAQNKIECMRLVVFPADEKIQKILNELYSFDNSCAIKLEVSFKRGIVCNSNQNSDKKALSNFPTSYLRMQISKDKKLFYSYYIDLTHNVEEKDVKTAYERITEDLIFF